MALYLTISRGPRADRAEPILASSDPHVIQAVFVAIGTLADDPEIGPEPNMRILVPRKDRHDTAR